MTTAEGKGIWCSGSSGSRKSAEGNRGEPEDLDHARCSNREVQSLAQNEKLLIKTRKCGLDRPH